MFLHIYFLHIFFVLQTNLEGCRLHPRQAHPPPGLEAAEHRAGAAMGRQRQQRQQHQQPQHQRQRRRGGVGATQPEPEVNQQRSTGKKKIV